MYLYHETMARLWGYLRVVRGLPYLFRKTDEFGRRSMLRVLYRIGHADYWMPRVSAMPCGCLGYRGHIFGYDMDCPDHGMSTWWNEASV